jgi:hypothetical protein
MGLMVAAVFFIQIGGLSKCVPSHPARVSAIDMRTQVEGRIQINLPKVEVAHDDLRTARVELAPATATHRTTGTRAVPVQTYHVQDAMTPKVRWVTLEPTTATRATPPPLAPQSVSSAANRYNPDDIRGRSSRKGKPAIPLKLWFTYKHDLLVNNEPAAPAANVRHTIASYRAAWAESDAVATVLSNEACRALLESVEPRLVSHFDAEERGMYKADICRVAALFNEGGYYFDIDLEVIQPLDLLPTTKFATVGLPPCYVCNCCNKSASSHARV